MGDFFKRHTREFCRFARLSRLKFLSQHSNSTVLKNYQNMRFQRAWKLSSRQLHKSRSRLFARHSRQRLQRKIQHKINQCPDT